MSSRPQFIYPFKPKDILALLTILTWAWLRYSGIDATASPAVFLIIGYYFAKRDNGSDNGS